MPQAIPTCDPRLGGITVATVDGQRVLRLSGEIDGDVVAAFGASSVSDESPITMVDLRTVTFLSSGGVGFLVRQTEPTRRAGRMPVLLGATRPARRVMELTGVDRLFVSAA